MTEPHNARRDAPVICAECGLKAARKAKQQRYCSDRCREKGKDRSRKALMGGDTGAPPNPPKNISAINNLQGAKSGSSIPINVLGGPDFQAWTASHLDRATWSKICRAEIAEPPADVWGSA